MNGGTLIAACGYAGDVHQIEMFRPCYEHHEAPFIVLSPSDSRIEKLGPHICRHAGARAYIGQASLDRQKNYLQILAEYPYDWFLMNDSDSFCLSPKIPKYLYADPDSIYSNEVGEPRPHLSPYPKVAMQPPYWFSRKVLEKFLAVAEGIQAHPVTPYVDFYMLELAHKAEVAHKTFTAYEIPSSVPVPVKRIAREPWEEMFYHVGHMGRVMVHPIKKRGTFQRLRREHKNYVKKYGPQS